MQKDFIDNLALLCTYYPSVSDVCRRLNIHRSQFNKYLGGHSFPSRSTLRRICDFFGVEQHEIVLPAYQFKQILQVRPTKSPADSAPPHQAQITQLLRASAHTIAKYAGFYFEYYYSMTYPDLILRALVSVDWDGEAAYFTRSERMLRKDSTERSFKAKYKGIVQYLGDRLFLTDYESLMQSEVSHTILFPSYKSRTTYLTGLRLGVAAEGRRLPTCTRVVYEVLGREINTRAALRLCGLYDKDSDSIAPDIKQLINNRIEQDEHHFTAVAL